MLMPEPPTTLLAAGDERALPTDSSALTDFSRERLDPPPRA